MRYKLLGNSGLRVSEVALGTMTFGPDWGWGASKEDSQRQFDLYVEAGGNLIDTSVNYTNGTAETFVGEFIQGKRDSLVVSTKYTLSRQWDDPNAGGNSRKNLRVSLETSLRHLNTDYIDLLWVHVWDYMTPYEEVMRGLDDLVRAGKVLYIGISDSPAYVAARASTIAELRGWTPFVGLQAPYSLAQRDAERELMPMAKDLDMGVLVWSVLGGGLLTGKYSNGGADAPKRYRDMTITEQQQRIVDAVQAVAAETEHPAAQVALNWVRQQYAQGVIIPILGARRPDQLQNNLAALEWELTPDQLARLDEASRIDLGFPMNFAPGNRYVFGNTFDKIDNHRA